MARALQMPSWAELPKGPRRDFVEEMFGYYREAKRPTLSTIEERIKDDEALEGFASRETIRKILTGKTIPPSWQNVYAVFKALCEMAGHDQAGPRWVDHYDPEVESRVERIEFLWNAALDDPGPPPPNYGLASDDEPPF